MWRTRTEREESARERLELAKALWNWTPHEAQARLFCCPAPIKVAACGRRWGKTESLSIDIATLALREPSSRQIVVAPTDAQARILGDAILERLETVAARAALERQGRNLVVRRRPYLLLTLTHTAAAGTTGQATIACRTAGRDGRGLRGLWAHRIIVDEAARVPDGVLEDVLPPMLADQGGEFLLASSPFGRRSAFYRLYARGVAEPNPATSCDPSLLGKGEAVSEEGAASSAPADKSSAPEGLCALGSPAFQGRECETVWCESFQCPTTDNAAHLDLAWLQAQREDMGEALYAQEYQAQFVDDFGAVFREEDIDAAIATLEGVRLERGEVVSEPEDGHPYVIGIDWGRKWDYTVVAVLDAARSPIRLVHLSRWRGTGWETQAVDAARIIARFRPRRVLADGSSIGDPIAEMLTRQIDAQMPRRQNRPTVERFLFGAESKQALVDRLNVGLSARALCFPPHRTLLAELRGFEYAPGEGSRLKTGARSGGHDDCVIALALAYYAAPDPAGPPAAFGILLGSQMGGQRRAG